MTPDEIKLLGDSEIETGKVMATGLGIVSAASLVIISLFTVAVMPDLLLVVFLLTVGIGSAAATGALFWAWRRRNTLIALFIRYALPAPESAPVALPALPAVDETIRVTVNGREGDISRETIEGFDPRDLAYLFRALERGEKFTEANLEKWELPHSHEILGKAAEGTPYSRFIDLCVRAGIIGGREPKKSGVLLVTDAAEMMRMVKQLPD